MEPVSLKTATFFEKVEAAQALSIAAAMGVVPLFRRRVGLRVTRGICLWPVILIMAAIGYNMPEQRAILYYSGVVLSAALWQHWNRWKELKKGFLTHTRSLGVSPLASIPFDKLLPPRVAHWITDDDRIHRLYDPMILFAIGLAVRHFNPALGLVIMFCACGLRIFEEFHFQEQWNKLFDMLDSMLDGEEKKDFMDSIKSARRASFTSPATHREMSGTQDAFREQLAARQREADAAAEQRRREALAEAAAERRTASAAAPPPPPQTVHERETIIIATAETRETVREKETLIHERETVQPVIVAVSMPPQIEAAPTSPALTSSNGHHAELIQEADLPALPAPPKELPAPQEDGAETTE